MTFHEIKVIVIGIIIIAMFTLRMFIESPPYP